MQKKSTFRERRDVWIYLIIFANLKYFLFKHSLFKKKNIYLFFIIFLGDLCVMLVLFICSFKNICSLILLLFFYFIHSLNIIYLLNPSLF